MTAALRTACTTRGQKQVGKGYWATNYSVGMSRPGTCPFLTFNEDTTALQYDGTSASVAPDTSKSVWTMLAAEQF